MRASAESVQPLVVLFDVDETLVHTGGAGARSWMGAFDAIYGIAADIGEHSSAGETDPQVARATFAAVLHRDPTDSELGQLYARYLLHLADEIGASPGYRTLPGVVDTLTRLSGSGVTLGLVSGAMEGAARTKLIPADLNRYFVFGAYGSDAADRAELTQIAIDKARRLHRSLNLDQVFVVGDTPRDVAATNATGAVSVGVATGHYTVEDLRAAGGRHVLSSLNEEFPGVATSSSP